MQFQMNNNSTDVNKSEYFSDDEKPAFYDFVHGLYIYVIPMIVVIGMICNVLSFKVFVFTSFSRHPSSIFLALLSVSDTFFLLALIFTWMGTLKKANIDTGGLCLVTIYITYVTSFLSVWCVVLIMLDRFIIICFPLRRPRVCSNKMAKCTGIAITVFSILIYSHCFLTIEVVPVIGCRVKQEYFRFLAMVTYIDTAITFIIPFIAIFVLNIYVIVIIRKFNFKHAKPRVVKYYSPTYNVLSVAQMRLTVMLTIVSIVFLVLNLPSHAIRFYIIVNDLIANNDMALFLTQQFCQILYYVNFSINFTIYFVSSNTFRRCIKERVRCMRYQ